MTEEQQTQQEEPKFVYEEVPMDEDRLKEKKIQLLSMELNKDDSDLQLEHYLEQLDMRLPMLLAEESIAKLEKDIAEKKTKDGETYRDATPAELLLMNLQLKNLKKQLELDMPMRDLRFKVAQIRFAQEQPDAPHKNIKKLEKEVREKKETIIKPAIQPQTMVG